MKTPKIRRPDIFGGLGAFLRQGNKGPFHIDTVDISAFFFTFKRLNGLKLFRKLLLWQRHGRGAEGRDAVGRQIKGHFLQRLFRCVGHIASGAAVDVNIDKPRQDSQSAEVDAFAFMEENADAGDLLAFDGDIAARRFKIRAVIDGVFQKHR